MVISAPVKSKINPHALVFVSTAQNKKSFEQLAIEEQEAIWRLTFAEARLVQLRTTADKRFFYSPSQIPVSLHVCKYSRQLALTNHRLAFAAPGDTARVYFNFDLDTIYSTCPGCFGPNCAHKATWTEDHKNVRSVVYVAPLSFKPFIKISALFPSVRSLILIRARKTGKEGDVVKWADLKNVEHPFDWQVFTLMSTYRHQLAIDANKFSDGFKYDLDSIQRMTIDGAAEVKVSLVGDVLSFCCC